MRNCITTLEEIKSGSILCNGNLKDYAALNLKPSKKRLLDAVVSINKRGLFATNKNTSAYADLTDHTVRMSYEVLENMDVVCTFTIKELVGIFDEQNGRGHSLDRKLDFAAGGEFSNTSRMGRSFKSYIESSTEHKTHYRIALVFENINGKPEPAFRKIFDFLPYYK
jgi:hypothetical protein